MSTPGASAPQQAEVDILLGQFGAQAPALKRLLEGFIDPLHIELTKLRKENADLKDELDSAKTSGKLTIAPLDLKTFASDVASSLAPKPKNKIEAVLPAKFEGKADQVDPFLSASRLYFTLRPADFTNEGQKILWMLQLFTKDAEPWARTRVKQVLDGTVLYTSVDELVEDIRRSFANVSRMAEARQNLKKMEFASKEGLGTFINRFRSEAEASEFDTSTLAFFLQSALPEYIHIQVAAFNQGRVPEKVEDWYRLCHTLDSVRATAHHVSSLPSQRKQPPAKTPPNPVAAGSLTSAAPTPQQPSPMDVDGHRRGTARTCYNCGEVGHISRQCSKPRQQYLRAADIQGLVDSVNSIKSSLEKKQKEDFPEGQQ